MQKMSQIWVIIFYSGLFAFKVTDGRTEVEVQLNVPRYVERGTSTALQCQHNVDTAVLFKVSWFHDEVKFFEYVKGRKPPFKNFTLDGADIDWEFSNESQVTLLNVDFKLSGQFHCEVSMTSPLYTKASTEHLMSVFLPQTGPPVIRFRKRSPVAIGERLFALCNTTRARPAPHITWLLNGKKVDDKYVRTHHVYSLNGKTHRRTQQQEKDLDLSQAKQKKQQISILHHHGDLHSQNQQYYEGQIHMYNQPPPLHLSYLLTDRYDKSLRWGGNRPMEDLSVPRKSHHHHYGPIHYNNPFSALTIVHDIDIDDYHEAQQRSNYDNNQLDTIKKHLDVKKHKNSSSRTYRHINENAFGILRSTLNSGGFGPQLPTMNNNMGLPTNYGHMNTLVSTYGRSSIHGSVSGLADITTPAPELQQEKGLFSVSQLNIELTEQHVDATGRLEITCLSTIPSAIGHGEQFADYKTYSIRMEVGRAERDISSTSTSSPNIGMAALGNGEASSTASSIKMRRYTLLHQFRKLMLSLYMSAIWRKIIH